MGMQYEPGRYHGRITNQGFSKTKKGGDQFFLVFDIIGKINPSDPEGDLLACNPGERTAYFTLTTDKNAEFFVKDMKRLGCPMTSFGMLDPSQPNCHSFTNVEAEFTCEENNWEGKQNERWQLSRESFAPVAVPLDAKEARRLDALFGSALKGSAPQPAKRSVAKTNGDKPAGNPNAELMAEARRGGHDADVPF